MRQRDYQRSRVYQAERRVLHQLDRASDGVVTAELAGSTITVPVDVKFGSLTAAQTYVDHILAAEWFRARFPVAARRPVTVRQRRSGVKAHYETGCIALHEPQYGTGWALRELVVLHELAHHATVADGPDEEPSHGPWFAGAFLELLGNAVGPEVQLLMRVAFADDGVDVAIVYEEEST